MGQHDNQLYLGVFLCFASESEVCVLKLVCELGVFKLIRHCTVYAPDVSSQFVVFCLILLGQAKIWRLKWPRLLARMGEADVHRVSIENCL